VTQSGNNPDSAFELIPPGTRFTDLDEGFKTFGGGRLCGARVGYETWGRLNAARDNAALILGEMSASAHAASHFVDPKKGWWEDFIGRRRVIDTEDWYVICVAPLGGCFCSTGPASINPKTGSRYNLTFPKVSIEDIADSAAIAVRSLGVTQLACVIGTLMGGMSALSLLDRHPDVARSHINICGAIAASPFAIALRSMQRRAILTDPMWKGGEYVFRDAPASGTGPARRLGTLSCRSQQERDSRFGRSKVSAVVPGLKCDFGPEFMFEEYLGHQADRFLGTYGSNCHLYLSKAIDQFDLGNCDLAGLDGAFSRIRLDNALVIGSTSDMLFPPHQQDELAAGLRCRGRPTESISILKMYGHDAFLNDIQDFADAIENFFAGDYSSCTCAPRQSDALTFSKITEGLQ